MSRYDPPDPICHHKPKGRVQAGDLTSSHASTYVCDRPACIEDAMAWARAFTHREPRFVALHDGGESMRTESDE